MLPAKTIDGGRDQRRAHGRGNRLSLAQRRALVLTFTSAI
jgi:hypothetical protein